MCGALVPVLAKKPYRRKQRCDRWDCDRCRARKIKECQTVLQGAGLAVTVWAAERPPSNTDQEVKALDNFLSRKVKGKKVKGGYWTVRSDLRIVIISRSAFPDAIRLRTKYVISSLLPDVLTEPWNYYYTKRFTRPQGQDKKPEKNTDTAYAQWIGDPAGADAAMKEFSALTNDHDRAKCLLHHIDEINLYNKGKEILEEYQVGIEASIRGASPPEPPGM